MRRLALLTSAVLASSAATAQDAPPGATACTGCHGTGGLSLDGLSADDIAAAMAAFRSGTREATLMGRIAAGFSEAEDAAIARSLAEQN